MSATPTRATPVTDRVALAHAVRLAKVVSERADADAAQAASEAQEARARLTAVEAEYAALKTGAAA